MTRKELRRIAPMIGKQLCHIGYKDGSIETCRVYTDGTYLLTWTDWQDPLQRDQINVGRVKAVRLIKETTK